MNGPDGQRFVWGRIVKVHNIGPYDIVEYVPSNWDRKNPPATEYHPYVKGVDTHTTASSLDEALVLAIAINHNAGTMAATYFMKMLKP